MHVPVSTYRLQLHAGFPFAAATEAAEYLARLGAAACYTSPYFTATPGSTHGYDVVDHNAINPELGGPDAHARFVGCLAELGLQHIVDFVPNHMGVGTEANAWWRDVLENGPASPAARFFDVDWTPVKAALQEKLLLPILGDQYGRVLERGELTLAFRDGLLVLIYGNQELPINPKQVPSVLRRAVGPMTAALGADSPHLHEFLSILTSLQNLPGGSGDPANPGNNDEHDAVTERQREKEVARARLSKLVSEHPEIGTYIEEAVREANGEVGRPETFNALHELLETQAYRLAYWRTASHEINYRRFFDVNSLAGLRVEDPIVFAATHELLTKLIREGHIQGVRVDHPDGLFDPARYFRMLQDIAAPDDLYVLAEKILSSHEKLPDNWPVAGTTGYDYLNDQNGIFVSVGEGRRVRRVYTRLTGRTEPFDDVLYASKKVIMATAMASELNVLAHALAQIAEGNRRSRDFTLDSLRDTIVEVVACFPVYRTYVDEYGWAPGDRSVVERAIVRARRRNPAMEASLFDFFREVILPRNPEGTDDVRPNDRRVGYPPADAAEAAERLRFAMKLQQYTGPVQAKGLEDTAFYRFNLMLSLNEVGGDGERFGRSTEEFHDANARRLRERPFAMLATATHDTKLGEDTRARLNVISEIADDWAREVSRWMRMNRAHRTIVDGDPAPDRNDEYRFYQALVGIWPTTQGHLHLPELMSRLQAYMIKSVKEAKLHTSWLTPNEDYENAVARFVERALTGPGGARFVAALGPMVRRIARAGMVNSLAQVALKIGSPGVPDFYQGTELWDFSLVDPDNRRPVDFDVRRTLLDEIDRVIALSRDDRTAAVSAFLERWEDGRIKLLLTAIGLRLRRDHRDLFLTGHYQPLVTESAVRGGLIAFARVLDHQSPPAGGVAAGGDRQSHDREAMLFVLPRLIAPLVSDQQTLPLGGEIWKTSRVILPPELAGRTFRHEITGADIQTTSVSGQTWIFAGQVFETIPIGVLRAL